MKKDWFETFKKIGASIIITMIVLIMGTVMFLPGSIQDYTGMFGRKSPGTFDGRNISWRVVENAYRLCRRRFGKFKNVAEFFINSCTTSTVKALYVLPVIGGRYGIEVSRQSIEDDVLEDAKFQYRQIQKTARDEDDKLSLSDLYQRRLKYHPLDIRIREANTYKVEMTLGEDFPYPEAMLEAEKTAAKTVMDIRYIRYNNIELLKRLDKSIVVREHEIREAFEIEQKKLTAAKRKKYKYSRQRDVLLNRLKSKKKQKFLIEMQKKLNRANVKLDDASRITGMPIRGLRGVAARDLSRIPAKDKKAPTINLALPEFLAKIRREAVVMVGPIKDASKRYTLFVEARNIRISEKAVRRKKDKKSDEKEEDPEKRAKKLAREKARFLARQLLNHMRDQEARRGEFKMAKVKFR